MDPIVAGKFSAGLDPVERASVDALPGLPAEAQRTAARDRTSKIQIFIGSSAEIVFHEPGALALSEGKAKRVIDHRRLK